MHALDLPLSQASTKLFEGEIRSYKDEVDKLILSFVPEAASLESTTKLDVTGSQLSLVDVRSSLMLLSESQAKMLRSGSSKNYSFPTPQLSGELVGVSCDFEADKSSPEKPRPASTPPRIRTPLDEEEYLGGREIPTQTSLPQIPQIPHPSFSGEPLPRQKNMQSTDGDGKDLLAGIVGHSIRRLSAPNAKQTPPETEDGKGFSTLPRASLPSPMAALAYSQQISKDEYTGQDLPEYEANRPQSRPDCSVSGQSALAIKPVQVDPLSGLSSGVPETRRKSYVSEQVITQRQSRDGVQGADFPQDRRRTLSPSEQVVLPLQDPNDLAEALMINARPASGSRNLSSVGSSQTRSYNPEFEVASNIVSSTSNMPDGSRATDLDNQWIKKEAKYKKKLHATVASSTKVKMELIEKDKELKLAEHEIEVLKRQLREMEHLVVANEMRRKEYEENSSDAVERLSHSMASPIGKIPLKYLARQLKF